LRAVLPFHVSPSHTRPLTCHAPRSCNGFCEPGDLKVMDEVEYGIVRKNGKLSADEIRKLAPGSIPAEVSYGH